MRRSAINWIHRYTSSATFGANPIKLANYGLADETEKINQAAASVARDAAGERASVLGAIGPEKGARVVDAPSFQVTQRDARAILITPRVGWPQLQLLPERRTPCR